MMKRVSLPMAVATAGLLLQACGGPEPPPAPARSERPADAPPAIGPTKDLPASAYAVKWGACEVPPKLVPGQEAATRVTLKNASPVAWPGGAGTSGLLHTIRLSYRWLRDGKEVVPYGSHRAELPLVVAPGADATVEMVVEAPAAKGRYQLQFDLLHEGVVFFEHKGNATKLVDVQVGK